METYDVTLIVFDISTVVMMLTVVVAMKFIIAFGVNSAKIVTMRGVATRNPSV